MRKRLPYIASMAVAALPAAAWATAPAVEPIPTLGQVGFIGFGVLLGIGGIVLLVRRRRSRPHDDGKASE